MKRILLDTNIYGEMVIDPDVVSEDEKSMLTENAVRAYRLVNEIIRKRAPDFIGYEEFKKILRGG